MPAILPTCTSTRCWRASSLHLRAQACSVSRHRYPCRRRPLRPSGPEPSRSGEWRDGIARVWQGAAAGGGRSDLLAPYLDAVAALNPDGTLRIYPGSPLIAQHLLRPQDRLIACELEPRAAAALARGAPRRPPRQGARDRRLDGARRLCAAQGAPRPRPGRSAVRGRRRFHAPIRRACGRAPQMADRHLHALVSDQGARGARRPGAAAAEARRAEDAALRTHARPAARATPASSAPA